MKRCVLLVLGKQQEQAWVTWVSGSTFLCLRFPVCKQKAMMVSACHSSKNEVVLPANDYTNMIHVWCGLGGGMLESQGSL